MKLKENINKIHYSLVENFTDTQISEKEDYKTGKFFEISTHKDEKQLKMRIKFTELDNSIFNWSYSENPMNESSDWIERSSTSDNFTTHIYDIFEKNRFSQEYINQIKK
jgi:hypothetical protein